VVVVGCDVGIVIMLYNTKGEKLQETRSDISCSDRNRISVTILNDLIGIGFVAFVSLKTKSKLLGIRMKIQFIFSKPTISGKNFGTTM
jgi:hypothetical protein